uniref:Solute carrier family 40 member n=1 Tax=Opuntia streptacantha TaxID=393608 RepID=A0A7C8Z423_OPUST
MTKNDDPHDQGSSYVSKNIVCEVKEREALSTELTPCKLQIRREKIMDEENRAVAETERLLLYSQNQQLPTSLIRCLYLGHFLSRWSARMWEFSVALYMINIWPDSLLLTALYGVVESASIALFGPLIGQWVNSQTYVKVLQLWTLTQNLSFIIAGGTVISLLLSSGLKSLAFVSLVSVTYFSGAVAVLSTLAGTILIEREWVVVMSEDQPHGVLTKMNSVLRRIDLVCKLFAPVVSGFIFWYFDDCCIGMGRNAGIYNRHSPRHKCYYWNCCNLYLSCLRISDINSQDRTLVHLVSVVIPPVMRWFYLGPKWHRISIHVNCRCCSIPPWIMDV